MEAICDDGTNRRFRIVLYCIYHTLKSSYCTERSGLEEPPRGSTHARRWWAGSAHSRQPAALRHGPSSGVTFTLLNPEFFPPRGSRLSLSAAHQESAMSGCSTSDNANVTKMSAFQAANAHLPLSGESEIVLLCHQMPCHAHHRLCVAEFCGGRGGDVVGLRLASRPRHFPHILEST